MEFSVKKLHLNKVITSLNICLICLYVIPSRSGKLQRLNTFSASRSKKKKKLNTNRYV